MCVLASPATVYTTRFFATRQGKQQILVCETKLQTLYKNAMVLPVPVHSPDAHVELIDLSGNKDLFERLQWYFISPPCFGGPGGAPEIFQVGSFEATIARSVDDLRRIDARFRPMPGTLEAMRHHYPDHAFVVYQFDTGKQWIHPFAFSFESRYPNHLFFPTLHVEEGLGVPAVTDFQYEFFAQRARLDARHVPFHMRPRDPSAFWAPPEPQPSRVRPDAGLPPFIDPDMPLDWGRRVGTFVNEDVFALVDG